MTLKHGSDSVKQLDLYLSGVVLLPVCIFGVISNILVVIVLTRKSMRTSTNCFLLALAIFDSILLICTSFMVCLTPLSSEYKDAVFPLVLPYIYPIGLIAQTCTIWIVVSFTIERYIAIRYPLKAASMCTIKRARMTCLIVSVIAVLYNMTRWFEYRYEPQLGPNNTVIYLPGTDLKVYKITYTHLATSDTYEWVYFTGLYVPFMCIIPVILLVVLNTFLLKAVHRSQRERKTMGNTNVMKENNITIMLVSVVVVFIICQVPAVIYNVAYGVAKDYITESKPWQMLSIIRNFTVTLNSAVNFILYCAFGQKFRKVFLKLFCKCWLKLDPVEKTVISQGYQLNNQLDKTNKLSGKDNSLSCFKTHSIVNDNLDTTYTDQAQPLNVGTTV